MAKKSGKSYRDIISSIRKGEYAPVYLLSGPESYFLDLIVSWIEKSVVEVDAKDFNQEVYYGSDTTVAEVITSAQQYPMMSDRRVVILKEAQSLTHSKTQLQKFETYFSRPNQSTVLVVVYKGDVIASNSKLAKAVEEGGGITFQSPLIKEYELKGPIRDYLDENRIGMDEDAVELLISFTGNNLNKLFGEIKKLALASANQGFRINRDMVLENIGLNKDFNVFELRKAVAAKDFGKAMRIVDYFASNKKDGPVVVVTSTLFSFFSKLTLALFASDKGDSALIEELDLSSAWQLREYRDAMRFYNAVQALRAISLLHQLDCKSKGIGSMQDEYSLLKETLFEIIRP